MMFNFAVEFFLNILRVQIEPVYIYLQFETKFVLLCQNSSPQILGINLFLSSVEFHGEILFWSTPVLKFELITDKIFFKFAFLILDSWIQNFFCQQSIYMKVFSPNQSHCLFGCFHRHLFRLNSSFGKRKNKKLQVKQSYKIKINEFLF